MSEEEMIRKAEIISARRNNVISANSINTNKSKKISSLSKLFIQVLTSICIFGIMYFLHQNNSNAIELIKPVISEDTDFQKLYSDISETLKNIKKEDSDVENNENQIEEENKNEINNEETDSNIIKEKESNIEDDDIAFITKNSTFAIPVKGTITSSFGEREATDIISGNHKGVDIGADIGTDIVASMEGNVEEVSSEGEYGNHIIITNGEISTLYAHCSKLLVEKGQHINQGEKIAEVGSTGKATGPHLHFEIRRNNTAVDPQQIIEFN